MFILIWMLIGILIFLSYEYKWFMKNARTFAPLEWVSMIVICMLGPLNIIIAGITYKRFPFQK